MLHRFSMFSIVIVALAAPLFAQKAPIVWSERERPIMEQIRKLRDVPDNKRAAVTKELALEIRRLPLSANKLTLADSLADLSTEGDFGYETLQEVATTLADTLQDQAAISTTGMPEEPYVTLAQLVRYEHVKASANSPLMGAAMARLQADEQRRQKADFTLRDLQG
ncbi:MAG TPA: hypothetical protein VFC21_00370, partial [Bryobacteraceae bacterium]|nr:hypothetical protein [Bryobacteraceae bacterium]